MSKKRATSEQSFRERFARTDPLIGSFIKTPTSHAVEILGSLGYDFVVIDEEHAPFDRATTDIALLAAAASGVAGIVRIANSSASNILSALDCGASGILVPHVSSVEKAREVASFSRYRGGRRGFSSSARAGGYGGIPLWRVVEVSDARTTVIAMIEDPEALECIDEIVKVDGIDGFFIGRGDLTVALGAENASTPDVKNAVARITSAVRAVGKPLCVMIGSADEAASFIAQGVSAFIVSSDQGFMRNAAMQALTQFEAQIGR